jgi:hypothetical protein
MQSDLELLVEYDMYELGYDPTKKQDIKDYWEHLLNGN